MINKIQEEVQEIEYSIEQSPRNGTFTLVLKREEIKQYVLSKYTPQEHALKMLGDEWNNKSTVWILFGFGFGYMLEKILATVGEKTNVVIIEPNEDLLKEQIEICNLEKLKTLKNIRFISGIPTVEFKNILRNAIPETEFNNINIRAIEKYLVMYNSYYKLILEYINEVKNQIEVSFYTSLKNEEVCTKNTIKNRQALLDTYDFSNHRNKYRNVPALIVGAGPSLAKNIDQIAKFKGIIIVMGRTMTPIIERGITPDFVVSLDPFDVIYDTFNKYKVHNIPLITLSTSNYKVVEGSKGPRYFLYNNVITSELLRIKVNPCLALYGSVSTLCLSAASYMGCNPIVFVGQDLAYTGKKRHSELALKNGKDKEVNEETGNCLPQVRGYNGETLETSYVWISIMKWIENFIENNRENVTYINATEDGAYINGALHIPLKETIEKYCINEKPIISHKIPHINKKKNAEDQLKVYLKNLRDIYRALQFGELYYKKLILLYIEDKQGSCKIRVETIKKIERVDSIITKIENSDILIKIMMNKIKMVLSTSNNNKEPINETEDERRLRFLRLNCETYEQLIIECQKLIDLFKGELEQ